MLSLDSAKGFLGPIGDDLPSLIPLVFALTVFFYVFTFTWQIFDEKNVSFADDIEVLRLSSILKANSYVPHSEEFIARCNEANSVKRVQFKAGVMPLAVNTAEHFPGISIDSLNNGSVFFTDEEGFNFSCTNTAREIDIDNDHVLIRFFPVAMERDYKGADGTRHFFVKPMLLVVAAWR